MAIDILKPIWGFLPSGMVWNVTVTFSISFWMASCERVFPLFSLMATAFLTILGSSSPNLWVLLRYQTLCHFTLEIMLSFFFKTWWTHQLSAGSNWKSFTMAYLATWIGCDSLRLDNFSHNAEPSFHWQHLSQPAVDFLMVSFSLTIIFWSFTLRAEPFFLWSRKVSSRRNSFPLTSHGAYIDSSIMLAANSVISLWEIPPHRCMYPNGALVGSTNWDTVSILLPT